MKLRRWLGRLGTGSPTVIAICLRTWNRIAERLLGGRSSADRGCRV